MRTISVNIYSFDELSKKAKEKALEHFRNSDIYFWSIENEKTLEEFAKVFPVNIKEWEYGYRNYINFNLTCDDKIAELKGIRLMKYLYKNYEHILFKPKFLHTKIIGSENNITGHAKLLKDNCCVLTGYCIDDDILKPIYDFLKNPKDSITFQDLMGDCLQSWVYACNKEYEYAYSDEGIRGHIEANEYEFLEDGTLA